MSTTKLDISQIDVSSFVAAQDGYKAVYVQANNKIEFISPTDSIFDYVDTGIRYNTLTTSAASIDEGQSVTFTVNTANSVNGTTVGYSVTGIDSADLSAGSISGSITLTSDQGQVTFTLASDAATEGPETLTLTLDTYDSVGALTGGLSNSVSIADTSTSTTFSPDYTLSVTNDFASAYNFSGSDRNGTVNSSTSNPTLTFYAGDKVRFAVNASGHPFYVKTVNSTGTGNQATGTNGTNGQEVGNVDWTVPSTGTYYYNCQYHSSMAGTISVPA
jgi:plastocyanin